MERLKSAMPGRSSSGTQAVRRAIKVLRCIAHSRNQGVGLSVLCRQTGLIKSTAHRLTMALIAEGLVEQDGASKRYLLGAECHALGLIASDRFGLHKAAVKHVSKLAHETGDSAFFSIRQDIYSLCLLREEGDYPLKSRALAAGDRHPLGIGAGSQAMLSALSDEEVKTCIEQNIDDILRTYPNYDRAVLMRLVREGRAKGYSVNRGLVLIGSWGIGVAVRNDCGDVVGALSIATVESRLGPERELQLYERLRKEADSLEKDLQLYGGYLDRSMSK